MKIPRQKMKMPWLRLKAFSIVNRSFKMGGEKLLNIDLLYFCLAILFLIVLGSLNL